MTTKERIVKEALRLFLVFGPDKTSMNKIAEEVGISKPAIYHHFKNKEELELGVIDLFSETMKEWSMKKSETYKSVRDYLQSTFGSLLIFKEVAKMLIDEYPENATYSFDDITTEMARKNQKVKERFRHIFTKTRETIAYKLRKGQESGEIRNDLNPETIGLIIHSIVEGVGMIGFFDESLDLNEVGKGFFEQFWNLIKSGGTDE